MEVSGLVIEYFKLSVKVCKHFFLPTCSVFTISFKTVVLLPLFVL